MKRQSDDHPKPTGLPHPIPHVPTPKPTLWNWFPILLGVILLTLITGAYTAKSFRLPTGRQSNIPTLPVPTATPDPTMSWNTYTNVEQAFAFKYPPGSEPVAFTTGAESTVKYTNEPALLTASESGRVMPHQGYQIMVITVPVNNGVELKKSADEHIQIIKDTYIGTSCQVSTPASGMIGAVRTLQFRTKDCSGNSVVIIANHDNMNVAVTASYVDPKDEQMVTDILNTFEFK